MPEVPKRLGRGLDAILDSLGAPEESSVSSLSVSPNDIRPNPFQPRKDFDSDKAVQAFEDLKASIKSKGLIQPITVREVNGEYELIAGERRLRACQELGLETIPIHILTVDKDVDMMELALIENLQRDNLNPLEEAEAYHRLIQEFHYTQEKVAEKIGKNRSTIANLLRLRNLPEIIKEGIVNQQIAMGHARALLGVEPEEAQIRLFHKVVEKHLSVRETEKLVNNTKKIAENIQAEENGSDKQFLDQTSKLLSERIKSRVHIRKKGEKGKIEINFKTKNEFQNLIQILSSV